MRIMATGCSTAFEDDPDLIFADIHEDGRHLYPGTGASEETGSGRARGTKLNIPIAPGADDTDFFAAWARVEAYLEAARPEFIIMQCGADSLEGDPITHLCWTEEAHAAAAASLCRIADKHAGGGSFAPAAVATTAIIWRAPGHGLCNRWSKLGRYA